MASVSLYRKYRSQRFGDLVGQDHVTNALRNAVREDRVGHAYLFSGPRGTGKTSIARILAKALNCTNVSDDGEPCGTCENCVAITAGRFLDLFELDAASNNSVDNIRSLIETVNLGVGVGARMKVYLIDEVHMLSTGASNALLKTLEEPPEHVVFVLATTNPEKVLPTIRSRTQHFEFRLLTVEELHGHLAMVLESEGVAFDPDALDHLARRAAGSARDALSLLDQAIAHAPERLTAAEVDAALGGIAFETRLELLAAVADEDVPGALVTLHTLLDAGHDARRVADDLLAALRDAFLITAAAGRVRVDASDDQLDALRNTATRFGNAGLVRAIETLGAAIVDMRGGGAPDAQLVLEVALLRLARREAATPVQALLERVERLERQLSDGPSPKRAAETAPAKAAGDPDPPAPVAARPTLGALRRARDADGREPATGSTSAPPEPERAPPAPATRTDAPDAAEAPERSFTLDDVVLAWAAALEGLPLAVRRMIEPAQPVAVEGKVITFGIPPARFEGTSARFRQEAMTIRGALTAGLGTAPKFSLVERDVLEGTTSPGAPSDDTPAPDPSPPDDPDDWVDPADLVDAPRDPAPTVDSLTRLQDTFGATIVEEHSRETP